MLQRTLPRKKPNAIDRIFSYFRINVIRLFDSPPDAEGFPLCDSSLRPDRVVKPPATPSFMDYIFSGCYCKIYIIVITSAVHFDPTQ